MGKMDSKRLGALLFCALSFFGVAFLSKAGWSGAMTVSLAAGLLLCFGKPLALENRSLAQFFTLGILLWNTVMLGSIGAEVSRINGTENPLPGILLLLLACYGVRRKNLFTTAAVTACVIGAVYGILFLFAATEVEPRALIPRVCARPELLPTAFFPTVFLFLCTERGRKLRIQWFLGSLLLIVSAALITGGMNSEDFYTAAKSVNILGAMERLEPFVGAVLTAGAFCAMGSLVLVNRRILENISGRKNFPLEEIQFILSAILCIRAEQISENVRALGTTVCWGLIPVILQGIVVLKKVQKN